jgi:hypothetical protein
MGFMRLLQGWIGVVGLVACLNTISCFMNHKILADKVYTDLPSEGRLTACNYADLSGYILVLWLRLGLGLGLGSGLGLGLELGLAGSNSNI